MFDIQELKPFDCLLYGPAKPRWQGSIPSYLLDVLAWIIDLIICVKTWSKFCHTEIYIGNGDSVASRNGVGVGQYKFRSQDLRCVLRPIATPNVNRFSSWFWRTANGQKYDFLGLLCFFLAVKRGSPDRMFCSEFDARGYPYADIQAFAQHFDCDEVSPGMLLSSPAFSLVKQLY